VATLLRGASSLAMKVTSLLLAVAAAADYNDCVRTDGSGNIVGTVAFGYGGVGAGSKYCMLETCQACANPTPRATPYDQDSYCDMVSHSSVDPTQGGVCGKHQLTEDCSYVSCTYSADTGMQVQVKQTDESGVSRTDVGGIFLSGDQHECRVSGSKDDFQCTCKCATSEGLKPSTPGRCGPDHHNNKCDTEDFAWAKYCDESSGWCSATQSEEGGSNYDFNA